MSTEWPWYVAPTHTYTLLHSLSIRTPDAICVEDCINRLTQVECLPDDCKGGSFCMNQRYVLTYLFFFAVLSYDISFQVPASGICENRYCKDGEKGVWAACWRGFAKVRVVVFLCCGWCAEAGTGTRLYTNTSGMSFRILRLSSGCGSMLRRVSNIFTS